MIRMMLKLYRALNKNIVKCDMCGSELHTHNKTSYLVSFGYIRKDHVLELICPVCMTSMVIRKAKDNFPDAIGMVINRARSTDNEELH